MRNEVEVDSGRVRFTPRLFIRTFEHSNIRTFLSFVPGVRQVRTRGALTAWLGNQMLLPCRAWGTPGTEEESAALAARPLSSSTSFLISLPPPPPLLSFLLTLSRKNNQPRRGLPFSYLSLSDLFINYTAIALTTHKQCRILSLKSIRKRGLPMTSTLSIRMDSDLKAEAEEFFDDIGMNMTTAITCFFKKCVNSGTIPFMLARQKRNKHAELVAAFEEAKAVARDPNAPTCTDPDKLEEFLFS